MKFIAELFAVMKKVVTTQMSLNMRLVKQTMLCPADLLQNGLVGSPCSPRDS